MKNKLVNRIIATVSVIACSLCLVSVPTTCVSVNAAPAASGETAIAPCAEILEWVYIEADGKRYKRLYNCTTGQWETDWIYVGEA